MASTVKTSLSFLGQKDKQILQGLIERIGDIQDQPAIQKFLLGYPKKARGLFASYIHYNIHPFGENVNISFPIKVLDNNAFATMWTLELLTDDCVAAPELLKQLDIEGAVKALMEFHDKTRKRDDPLFMFWRQHKIAGDWVSYPEHLVPFLFLHVIHHFGEHLFKHILSIFRRGRPSGGADFPKRTASTLSLPADFDDSALNWAVGCSLYEMREILPDAWSAWSAFGFDFEKLARRAMACAYHPFANDRNQDVIDPRTFFAIREFLWDLEASGRSSADYALLTTWALNMEENREGIGRHYKMPFNSNNLDFSVQANFLFAAVRNALAGSFPNHVEGFTSLIMNTAEYLAWGVESETIADKPDLVLLYYPCPCCAFFFISRILHLLQNTSIERSVPEFLSYMTTHLSKAMRGKGTEFFLSSLQCAGDQVYWDSIAMSGRGSSSGADVYALKDRMFVTAISVNTLINVWTVHKEGVLKWLEDVPQEVPLSVSKAIGWLRQNDLSREHSDQNAFFSASVKDYNSLPYPFPANMMEHVEGPFLLPNPLRQKTVHGRHMIYAISGVPSREEYECMLQKRGLERPDGLDFKRCYRFRLFPYWSAPSVTYAAICLAISKCAALDL